MTKYERYPRANQTKKINLIQNIEECILVFDKGKTSKLIRSADSISYKGVINGHPVTFRFTVGHPLELIANSQENLNEIYITTLDRYINRRNN